MRGRDAAGSGRGWPRLLEGRRRRAAGPSLRLGSISARPRRGASRRSHGPILIPALVAGVAVAVAAGASAAQGAGSAGATVLQLPAGARAPALGSAYTGATGDADLVFFNPAGVGGLDAAFALAYQSFVEGIGLGSAAGAFAAGPVVIGAGLVFLDAGDIREIEPDPAFGGERGRLTGDLVEATETAGRLALATAPLRGLRLGAAAGVVSSDLAGTERSGVFFDVGAQYDLPHVTLGVALRHLGGALGDAAVGDAPLPTELRVGGAGTHVLGPGLGITAVADLAMRLEEENSAAGFGVEVGLLPGVRPVSAVARVGVTTGGADQTIAPLRLGAGIGIGRLAVDYTYQDFEFFGAVHRFGLRWRSDG